MQANGVIGLVFSGYSQQDLVYFNLCLEAGARSKNWENWYVTVSQSRHTAMLTPPPQTRTATSTTVTINNHHTNYVGVGHGTLTRGKLINEGFANGERRCTEEAFKTQRWGIRWFRVMIKEKHYHLYSGIIRGYSINFGLDRARYM